MRIIAKKCQPCVRRGAWIQLWIQSSVQLTLLLCVIAVSAVPSDSIAQSMDNSDLIDNSSGHDELWNEYLREMHFDDRPINVSNDVIVLNVPEHAEDPTVVPVTVYAMLSQKSDRYIEKITLIIDRNPVPLAGRFEFTPKSGRADVSVRVRIDDVTPVRAIAELNDGSLHMASQFVNASGGCSAPVAGDLTEAMNRAGKMKLIVGQASFDNKPISSSLRIRHPNITGMQTVGGEMSPAHFVQKIKVRLNDEIVFSAETDISISENPAFGFYIAPHDGGQLIAEVTDSAGRTFTKEIKVKAAD